MRQLLGAGLMILLASSVVAGNANYMSSPLLRSRMSGLDRLLVDGDRNPNQDEVVIQVFDPLKNANRQLRQLLAKKDTPPAIAPGTIEEFLEQSYFRFDVKFDIDGKAFRAVGLNPDDVLKKAIAYPRTKGISVDQMLRHCLSQARCTYEARGDTVFVVPKR